ncbi:YggT family protein [Fundicoccus ignavus]|uniref:YggT family protein n=1 Tax=Fundicoccus ignavus TaxID=2664442 RepID=A0A6I2GPT5_9LACT|nr:YggT family protein [Fundicoccus ignavus]MRI81481.1 YggT family protein [Fundicoccus ignavus]MRI85465.1 YggT family protein [Fundicoccus ignavus]MRJ47549.1 YggT family protein [Fundicoccus ignavus]
MIILLIRLVDSVFNIYSMVLVIYALLSWLPGAYESQLGQIIIKISKPYLDFFDRYIPPIGGISINVMIAIFVLQLIRNGVMGLLFRLF